MKIASATARSLAIGHATPRPSVSPLTGLANLAVAVMHHPQFRDREIVECLETRVQYVDPCPDQRALERIYDEEYNAVFGRDFGTAAPAFVERRALAQLKFLEGVPFGRVAEVGAGWGALASLLSRTNEVECYELDSRAVDYMRQKGLNATLGALEHQSHEQFDLVASSMMLEHLPRPLDALKAWRRCLSPEGHLFLEIPLENPVPNWWGADPARPYWVGHLTFFAKGHLDLMLHAAGFTVKKASYHDHPVSPGYVMPGDHQVYDLTQIPTSHDTQVSTADHPKLLRLLAQKCDY
ncbi:hypothetical protein CTAYLR_009305 [Chrysophaeum taylorii]|uniref:Class I SAM-dependent methyltransferase n=1 Tax=Chrysophaeum taylorii TaxID=2483200 RepID=A0AAD7UK67_9STRA|nr:hypothetical protein CTAYLR_009305 [Chrysophaeum taylorii]